ncbi:TPA: hypothetical protein HA225_03725, partial [Candidatus Micrarchaeota archaeon]|nr:hypothetical protein [Candidatus Micrarchaeota archaeon]
MNASEKIKVLLEIPPEVALNDVNPAVFQSIVKAYSEQTNYLKNKAQLIQTAAAFADAYQLWYPLGQPSLGFIKENVKFDPGNSSILKLEMESGRIKEDLDPKIIPDNIFQCAKEYYEFQIMTAHELGEQESKAKNPNQTILDLINSISSNASDHLYELEKIMSKGKTPETKMQAVKGLINFKTGHYEPAMQKIGEEKYWDQLYSIQGGSDYKKTLVFLHQHAHTGALWSAFGLSCLNPIAGQLAFGVMGAKGVAEGISSGSAQQILFGLAMMSGISRNPYISTTATAYMNADILTTSARQILTGMNTSFTPTDVESLSNNAVLLAGYFKSKPSNNDWTSKQQKKTGINAQVIIKETREKEAERPNRETPKGLENSKSNLGKDAGLIEELAKKGISLQAGEIEYLSMNGLTREKTEILMRSSNPKNLLYDLLLLSPEALRCYSNLIGRVGKIPAVSVSKNKSLAEELSQGRIPMVDLVSREGVTQFSKAFSYLHAIEELSGPLIQNSSKPVVLIVPLRGSYFPTRTAQLILSNARKSGAVSEIQFVSSPSNG